MPLIKPNTLVAFIDGSHFYNTHHSHSDYDIIAVELQDIRDVLANIKPIPRQEHRTPWLGNNVDITYYELTHFLELIAKGNIQIIEKVLLSTRETLIYYSPLYERFGIRPGSLNSFANIALSETKWGHLRGWMRKTMTKVYDNGLTIKRAILMCRMIHEAKLYLEQGKLECRFPELFNYEWLFGDNLKIFKALWMKRKEGHTELNTVLASKIERVIEQGFNEVDDLLGNYEPPSTYDIHREKENLIRAFRFYQIKEPGVDWFHGIPPSRT